MISIEDSDDKNDILDVKIYNSNQKIGSEFEQKLNSFLVSLRRIGKDVAVSFHDRDHYKCER